jgi:hypothetical protein
MPISLPKFLDSFYDFARRQLDIKTSVVDEYLANHGRAEISGRSIVLTYNDGQRDHVSYGRAGVGHGKHATEWVNSFNERSRKVSSHDVPA